MFLGFSKHEDGLMCNNALARGLLAVDLHALKMRPGHAKGGKDHGDADESRRDNQAQVYDLNLREATPMVEAERRCEITLEAGIDGTSLFARATSYRGAKSGVASLMRDNVAFFKVS